MLQSFEGLGLENPLSRWFIHITGKSVLAVGKRIHLLTIWLPTCPHNTVSSFSRVDNAGESQTEATASFTARRWKSVHQLHSIPLVIQAVPSVQQQSRKGVNTREWESLVAILEAGHHNDRDFFVHTVWRRDSCIG